MTGTPLDEIARDDGAIRQLGPSLFSSLPDADRAAPYDRKAALYDAVVGRESYQRLMWGTSPGTFRRLAAAALEDADGGWFAEAGCGSLLFTYEMHRAGQGPRTLLMDRSLGMLRRGVARLAPRGGAPRGNLVLLQADLADVPIRERQLGRLSAENGALVVVDGLNEVPPSATRELVWVLDEFAARCPRAGVIVCDRLQRRPLPSPHWRLATITDVDRPDHADGPNNALLLDITGESSRDSYNEAEILREQMPMGGPL